VPIWHKCRLGDCHGWRRVENFCEEYGKDYIRKKWQAAALDLDVPSEQWWSSRWEEEAGLQAKLQMKSKPVLKLSRLLAYKTPALN
jgi:hypothetical protein